MNDLVMNIKVPVEVRKKTTIVGVKLFDEFNVFPDKLVGIINGVEESTWFFKDYNMVQSANASLNTQFSQVVFVTPMNTQVKISEISMMTNLKIVNDENRILFCSGIFSYAPANIFAENFCRKVRTVFNEYKQRAESIASTSVISTADEIKKFKDLLDQNIITQQEFDQKKKSLLDT